jgi:hypothetical protein
MNEETAPLNLNKPSGQSELWLRLRAGECGCISQGGETRKRWVSAQVLTYRPQDVFINYERNTHEQRRSRKKGARSNSGNNKSWISSVYSRGCKNEGKRGGGTHHRGAFKTERVLLEGRLTSSSPAFQAAAKSTAAFFNSSPRIPFFTSSDSVSASACSKVFILGGLLSEFRPDVHPIVRAKVFACYVEISFFFDLHASYWVYLLPITYGFSQIADTCSASLRERIALFGV